MEENQPVNLGSEPKQEIPENSTKKYLFVIWEFFKVIVIAALIVLPIRYFIFQPFIVKGDSMIPNLHSRDYLIIDEISYRFSNPQRGDIVVLKYPVDERQRFIKRVIGLPGETIDISNGDVVISNSEGTMTLNESYLPQGLETEGTTHVTLGADEYFVMGDNRQFSYDSRRWGVLPEENIIGKAFFRVFPNADLIEGASY